jgi:putative colanic acid biosynthesis UDP-glucose lipid carrier transferase
MIGSMPLISASEYKINQFYYRTAKRLFDLLFSIIVIVLVLSWITVFLSILYFIFDHGSVLYKEVRWGKNSTPFYCYKYRSMKVHDQKEKHQITSRGDSRITSIGKFLRKTNLDELPQFVNVFLGNMSVVGPRPHDEKENLEIKDKINLYMWRHLVKPGITGWAQVHGLRGGTKEISLMKKRTQYDLWYIENWSFLLDIQIILLTAWRMFKGDPNAY